MHHGLELGVDHEEEGIQVLEWDRFESEWNHTGFERITGRLRWDTGRVGSCWRLNFEPLDRVIDTSPVGLPCKSTTAVQLSDVAPHQPNKPAHDDSIDRTQQDIIKSPNQTTVLKRKSLCGAQKRINKKILHSSVLLCCKYV